MPLSRELLPEGLNHETLTANLSLTSYDIYL